MIASAEAQNVVVAEDFFYAQPTKSLGAGGGFTRQDYGGGQNGDLGAWQGRWVSVGDGVITGTDLSGETFDLETDSHQAVTRSGLSVNWIERNYSLGGVTDDQSLYFGVTLRSNGEEATPNATFLINDASGEDQIGMGLREGGFRAFLGLPEEGDEELGTVPGPELTQGLDAHRLIGKVELNASGIDERLTVWLNPTDVETAEESIELEADILDGYADFNGNLRLDHLGSGGLVFWDDVAIGTSWESVQSVNVPRATLQADNEGRDVRFLNETGSDLEVTFLQLESERGLQDRLWNSLANQGVSGFMENNSTANRLTESSFTTPVTLSDGQSVDWGRIFRFRTTEDLVAHVGTSDGLLNLANVVYGPIVDETREIEINALCGSIVSGENDAAFDITGDGLVNAEDLDSFLEATGILIGDLNLDGTVGFPDFLVNSANFGVAGASLGVWTQGDVDCNGEVAFADFLALSGNFGAIDGATSGTLIVSGPPPVTRSAAAVPEPNAAYLLVVGLFSIFVVRRRS